MQNPMIERQIHLTPIEQYLGVKSDYQSSDGIWRTTDAYLTCIWPLEDIILGSIFQASYTVR